LEVAGTTGLLALGHAYAGDYDQAREHVERSTALLDGVPDGELAKHLGVVEVAWAESILHRHHDARRHFARGVAIARRTGQYHVLTPLLFGLATAETWLGELAAAREHAEAGAELARTLAVRSQHSAVLGALAETAYQQGALDEADRYAREAIAALPAEPMLWTGHAEGVIARVQLAQGDPRGCIDTLLRAGDGPDLSAYQPGMRPPWYDVIAQAELALGRVDEAAAWAERSAAVAPVFGADTALLLTRARILVASGEPDAAADAARRVVAYHRGTGMRIVEGDARRVLAAALAATGDRRAAQEELRRAKELFAACGARAMHAAVVADQRRTGAVKPRARTAGGEQLTERESEVAELVAAGYSNARVAAQLGLSPKTVQAHLSRVYAKLGVSSRAGLAARIGADPPH